MAIFRWSLKYHVLTPTLFSAEGGYLSAQYFNSFRISCLQIFLELLKKHIPLKQLQLKNHVRRLCQSHKFGLHLLTKNKV